MRDYYIAVIRQPQNMATYKWVLAIFHSLLYNEWVMDRQFNNHIEFGGVEMIIHIQNQIHLDTCFILDTQK